MTIEHAYEYQIELNYKYNIQIIRLIIYKIYFQVLLPGWVQNKPSQYQSNKIVYDTISELLAEELLSNGKKCAITVCINIISGLYYQSNCTNI